MAISDSALRNEALAPVAVPFPRAIVRRTPTVASTLLLAIEAVAIAAAWAVAYAAWGRGSLRAAAVVLPVTIVVALGVAASEGLYNRRVSSTTVVEAHRLFTVSAAASLAALIASAGHPSGPWLATAGAGGIFTFVALAGVRGCYDEWLRAERTTGRRTRAVVVIGSNGEATDILELFSHHPELGYRVRGLVGDERQAVAHGVEWLGDIDGSVDPVESSGVDEVIITPNGVPSAALNRLIRELLDRNIHVQLSSGLTGVATRRLHSSPLAHEPFFYVKALRLSRPQLAFKRAVDIVAGTAILVAALPIIAVASLATKVIDGGPVLFRQTRIGREGRPFVLYKLRTMVADAESRLPDVASGNQRHGPLFKLDSDPRVTAIGRVLRATSIDEMPQLWNVVRGEMSLVGPRPALPDEVEQFDADLHNRHRMKPGVTGLWQIEARDNPSFYAYRHLDLFYVENWSPLFDLAILLRTAPSVLVRTVHAVLGRKSLPEPQKGAPHS
ncbi:MAG: sugar transferase [Acidimicrobiales bacterium]